MRRPQYPYVNGVAVTVAVLLGWSLVGACARSSEVDVMADASIGVEPGVRLLQDAGAGGDAAPVGQPGAVDCRQGSRYDEVRQVCIPERPCSQNNGGCGDPAYVTCVEAVDGSARCEDVDDCALANPCNGYDCVNVYAAPAYCDPRCPLGSLDWHRDASLCTAPVTSFHALDLRHGCALTAAGELRCPLGLQSPWGGDARFRDVTDKAGYACAVRESGEVSCLHSSHEHLRLSDLGTSVLQVAAIRYRVCARDSEGRIRCLGTPSEEEIEPPQARERFVDLDGHRNRFCAVRRGGTLYCWGHDRGGALAQLNAQTEETFLSVSLGREHGCAVRRDQSVFCWSERGPEEAPLPDDRVRGPNQDATQDFVSISVGAEHTCALRESGEIQCWGGEISDEVRGPASWDDGEISHVQAMEGTTCVFGKRGHWRCWGAALPYGASLTQPFTQAPVEAYLGASCFRIASGEVRCHPHRASTIWGGAELLEAHREIDAADGAFVQFAYNPYDYYDQTFCGLRDNGRIHCWLQPMNGWDDGPVIDRFTWPDPESMEDDAMTSAFVASWSVCGLTGEGRVRCWAPGGDRIEDFLEEIMALPGSHLDFATSARHACVVRHNGGLACTGQGGGVTGPNASPHSDYRSVTLGRESTCAQRAGGAVDCWGTATSAWELPLRSGDAVVDVASNASRACALTDAGRLRCSGRPDDRVFGAATDEELFIELWAQDASFCALTQERVLFCGGGPLRYDGSALVIARRR